MYPTSQQPGPRPSKRVSTPSAALPARFAMFDGYRTEQPTATLHPGAAIAFAIAAAVAALSFIEIVFA